MICSVSAEAHTSPYRSIPARVSSLASARATATWPLAWTGQLVGSTYHRNSCKRSSEIVSRPPPDVSQRRAALASSATAGSSRASVRSASASVIMRPVCPTTMSRGRRVTDLAGDVSFIATRRTCPVCRPANPPPGGLIPVRPAGSSRLPGRPAGQLPARGPAASGIIAWVSGIYDEPELYQLACAYRDVPAEVSALLSWCGKHWQGGQDRGGAGQDNGGPRSVLELAAGPAEHALELARR